MIKFNQLYISTMAIKASFPLAFQIIRLNLAINLQLRGQ